MEANRARSSGSAGSRTMGESGTGVSASRPVGEERGRVSSWFHDGVRIGRTVKRRPRVVPGLERGVEIRWQTTWAGKT